MDIRFVIKKCPKGGVLPFVNIECAGDGCFDIGKPCDNDQDCDGDNQQVVCTPITKENEFTQNEIFDALADTDILLDEEDKDMDPTTKNTFCKNKFPKPMLPLNS